MALKTYPWNIYDELKTEEDIDGFIEASIEEAKNDTDPKYLIHAFETAARARAMINTAQNVDITSNDTDPKASTLAKIAGIFGYRLTFVKQQA